MTKKAKRDFGTLQTEKIALAGLSQLEGSASAGETVNALADIIIGCFDDYYTRYRQIAGDAKQAFETRNWSTSVDLSHERIAIFSVSISKICPILSEFLGSNDQEARLWDRLRSRYEEMTAERYEADLAMAYLAAIGRRLHQSNWGDDWLKRGAFKGAKRDFVRFIRSPGRMTSDVAKEILNSAGLNAPFEDFEASANAVAERINRELTIGGSRPLEHIEVVDTGFYRNRGAYIIGALVVAGQQHPLALALLNGPQGVTVDAVILRQATLSHVFSSTLANFHVRIDEYHELVDYLFKLMPIRPHGEHYSTIGYNHIGKIAIMNQIMDGLGPGKPALDHAPGPRGSVAIGFTTTEIPFILKIIRDEPTDQYKWDVFHGVESVLAKYSNVHEMNRSGSMLDNVIYSRISLPKSIFDPTFLSDVLASAANSVKPDGENIFFEHLIVQRKLTPVPIYLEHCTEREAEMVVSRLGQCIRNNAATNVFNKDLDGRNYGVSALRFVYLFDYDAVEVLTEVKVRTNVGRDEYDEDIPDWFFEDGTIFLPEELEAHLRLPDRHLRRVFREKHGDLLQTEFWTQMQDQINAGEIPRIRTYPTDTQL